jgi:predicted signal transduction protein with EAL and GGDEF domain
VAARLRGCVRGSDIVARLGGDEFAVVQLGAPQPAASNALARRLIEALAQPFDLDDQRAHVGTTVGIAVAPFDGEEPEVLLRGADLALYHAKAAARGSVRFFEPEMDAQAQRRRGLEADLRRALPAGELRLHFQPQVSVDPVRVTGLEALLRWQHPQRGLVSPLDFVPLAEETGLIVPIGRWVLQEACREAARWPAHTRVAVNVSAAQFRGSGLLQDVADALRASGLDAGRLEVEITESVMIDDTRHALETLRELRRLGVRIAMDDFGTGYSSLSYLRSFPFDRIKIDRSFVRDMEKNADALSIVRAVSGLGRNLGMATTVEGVETEGQLQAVRREGCAEAQGYLFSKPLPADQVPALLVRLDGADWTGRADGTADADGAAPAAANAETGAKALATPEARP